MVPLSPALLVTDAEAHLIRAGSIGAAHGADRQGGNRRDTESDDDKKPVTADDVRRLVRRMRLRSVTNVTCHASQLQVRRWVMPSRYRLDGT
jgi:hypothetical protein